MNDAPSNIPGSTSPATNQPATVAGVADPGNPSSQRTAPGSTSPATAQSDADQDATVAGVGMPDEASAKSGATAAQEPSSAPAYTFPPRVLKRWARSNLQLKPRADGGHDAEFRFHGSTCGNIEFDLIYHVQVGPPAEGRPLRELHCEPAPHGDGHTRMCCWREYAEKVKDWMQRETPLQGQPLDAALTWEPNKSASGCLCHVDGRLHKWNAVFQTLHFALSQTETSP